MRQPYAQRTGRAPLDQCYVYCWDTDVGTAVGQVKQGLEQEGLSGLGDDVLGPAVEFRQVLVKRRERFRGRAIFLPLVLHKNGDGWRELDYQQHILPSISWKTIDAPDPQASLPDRARRQSASVDVGDALPVFHPDRELNIAKYVQISWFARRLGDMVPNTWLNARLAREFIENLQEADDTDAEIYDRRSCLAFTLREHVTDALERNFARYLDEQKASHWWHRVAVRQRGDYYLRGWRRERIWPDFVAMGGETDGKPHVLVFETKGKHLDNPDTDYKRRVLETLQNAYNCGTMTVLDGPAKGTFRLVFNEAEFPAALVDLNGAYSA